MPRDGSSINLGSWEVWQVSPLWPLWSQLMLQTAQALGAGCLAVLVDVWHEALAWCHLAVRSGPDMAAAA